MTTSEDFPVTCPNCGIKRGERCRDNTTRQWTTRGCEREAIPSSGTASIDLQGNSSDWNR
jgi:hypothetical protein